MCGIIGYTGNTVPVNMLVEKLNLLLYRGYDSCGIAFIDPGTHHGAITVTRTVGTPNQLKTEPQQGTQTGIGHTRWATHGAVTRENAHPHISCLGDIAVVHNGTIDNYQEIQEKLKREGHQIRSETDTELIAHLLENNSLEEVTAIVKGTYALLVLRAGSDSIQAVRKDCPLVITCTETGVYIASDENALPEGGRYIPEDNKILEISPDFKAPSGNQRAPARRAEKGEYEHFMLKEIMEQPKTLMESVYLDMGVVERAARDILHSHQVVFTASGTSRYAAIIGRFIFSHTMERLGDAIAASEFHYFAPTLRRGTVVVAVSQSGETADVIHGLKTAKEKGAYIIAITNNPNSQLGRIADITIAMKCGPEIGVAASKTFTSQLAVFYLLHGAMIGKIQETQIEIERAATAITEVLQENKKRIIDLARLIRNQHDFYYLGRGINFAVAGESALKMKEVSYIHAEGLAAGELKHGTLALVGEGIPVCGICPNDYAYQETILNLQEVKARKGMVIGISDKRNPVFDHYIKIPSVPDLYYPLVCIVPTQLLAYRVAVERGLNPDFPRNLAKSVTVL